MGILESVTKLWQRQPAAAEIPGAKLKPKPAPRSLLDCRPDTDEDEVTLGVKYASKYSWHILPPAGWRRQESISGPTWPVAGSSPSVSFVNPAAAPNEQSLIKWHLLSVPESNSSHEALTALIYDTGALSVDAVRGVEAPGLVAGMKIHKVERVDLGGARPALLVAARVGEFGGEPPVLKYVLVLPDRRLDVDGEPRWYRESVQYAATEDAFYKFEPLAVKALKTFRRTADEQTLSGAMAAISAPTANAVR